MLIGIGNTCHGKNVEEVELSRLVRYLSPTHLYPLGVELGILSREIERIEKDHKSSIDQMFFVLLEWRKKLHSSFSDLEEALKRCNIDIHVLCEVCKTNVFETDVMKNLPSDILDKVLSDQELDEIAGYVGREYLHLCLQLGHTVSHIERVMDEKKYNFLEGIRVLLRDWRKSGHFKPTVKMLGCAWLQCGMDFNVFYNLFVKQEKDVWQLPFIF
ncbi:uncharacterized protein LOC134264925 [Saccostrea cucullata]|uniref:uncharacterized protein LOC134264925 n=1 Tax=Saccostrea cuccullata TaxID=36930 RepID=UPI002ED58883